MWNAAAVRVGCICQVEFVAFLPLSSVWSEPNPGAEDQAPPVLGGPGGMWDLERGLLSRRSLVRLVDGIRDRLGGRLASWFRVGLPDYLYIGKVHSGSLVHSGFYTKGGGSLWDDIIINCIYKGEDIESISILLVWRINNVLLTVIIYMYFETQC